jgi:hypothetical protein
VAVEPLALPPRRSAVAVVVASTSTLLVARARARCDVGDDRLTAAAAAALRANAAGCVTSPVHVMPPLGSVNPFTVIVHPFLTRASLSAASFLDFICRARKISSPGGAATGAAGRGAAPPPTMRGEAKEGREPRRPPLAPLFRLVFVRPVIVDAVVSGPEIDARRLLPPLPPPPPPPPLLRDDNKIDDAEADAEADDNADGKSIIDSDTEGVKVHPTSSDASSAARADAILRSRSAAHVIERANITAPTFVPPPLLFTCTLVGVFSE